MPEQPSQTVNDTEIRVIGMSRSGNHALIRWITAQLDGRTCFLNCAEPKTNPFRSARPLRGGHVYEANYDLDLAAEQAGDFSRKDTLVHSYEDAFLGMVCGDDFEQNHDDWVGPSARRVDVLVLRDPFNLFASRRRASYAVVTPHTARRIWKQHAREFAQGPRHLRPDHVLVRYNDWARDEAYRAEIARQLGLRFTDAGINRVPDVGAGSSFDGTAYDGRASEMDVLGRWRHYADDPDFLDFLDDPDLQALSDEVFGPIPGTEQLAGASV